jgi:hypothetical protein
MLLYTPDDYNQHGVLHVPFFLALTSLYLLKHWFIALFSVMKITSDAKSMIGSLVLFLPSAEHSSSLLLYACLPAILVTFSMARRNPKNRSTFLRWVWQRGRLFLLSSLLLEIGLLIFYIMLGIKKLDEVLLMFLYIDVILMIYLIRSQRVRDVFAEFPKSISSK